MLYTLVDRRFFEDVVNLEWEDTFQQAVSEALPEHWNARRNGVWLSVSSPQHVFPQQGFKIHLSGTPALASQIIRAAAPVCYAHDVPFKTARDPRMLSVMGSKHYPRGYAGKLMTVYPGDQDVFLRLIDALHVATDGFDGPYILSDRRYKDRGVVYYRYGEILSKSRLTIDGGSASDLTAPDGQPYREERLPYFRLPPWVTDPFANEPRHQGEHLLNDRYQVEKALTFSNAGGVYRALDRQTGDTVVLKEARPHTAHFRADSVDIDAIHLLEHEYNVLRRLDGISGVVAAIEMFGQWEHRYMVESHVAGMPLAQFRARHDVSLLPFDGGEDTARTFCRKFAVIALQLIDILQAIHARDVIVADLSPNNILVDPDTLAVCLIDFEGAHARDADLPEAFAAQWSTPGFRHQRRQQELKLSTADDWFGLGMVLYSMILPMQSLFDLEKRNVDALLDCLSGVASLPAQVPQAIRALWEAEPETARGAFERIRAYGEREGADPERVPAPPAELPEEDLQELLQGIDDFIDAVCHPQRQDQLWPGDPEMFNRNPISLAYGAGGPLLYRALRGRECTPEQRAWFDAKTEQPERLPPGLYSGLAGAACVYLRLGDAGRALHLLESACQSSLLGTDASIFQGDAGVAMACLQLHAGTGDERALQWAHRLGEGLLAQAITDEAGTRWPSQTQRGEHVLGYAYGGSGTALALLYLGHSLGDARYIDCARRAMDTEVSHAIAGEGPLRWARAVGHSTDEPYWLHGGSGVGTALIRFAVLCQDEGYGRWARQAAEGCYCRFTVLPGQVEGMSGIGEFMLDMHQLTGEAVYLARANALAHSIGHYRVHGQRSIAFPGRGLLRLSCDHAYGAAGVGSFLHRLRHGGERLLHDLPLLHARRADGPRP